MNKGEISEAAYYATELHIYETTGHKPNQLIEALNRETTLPQIVNAYLIRWPGLRQWVKQRPVVYDEPESKKD